VSDERLTSLRSRLDEYAAAVDIDAKRARIAELEGTMSQQGFWDDQERAHAVIDELKVTKGLVEPYEELERSVAACEELLEMAAGDDEALAELDAEIARLDEAYDALEIKLALSGPHDRSNIYLSIQPGAGGVEACDWAEMMLRMYTNYCQRAGYACDVLDVQPGDEAGIKGCTLYIKGPMAYGYFKSEMGTHRLVRMSPFNSQGKRQTSFAAVEVTPELPETEKVDLDALDEKEFRIDTYRASGAGGQHVNKTDSAVRITHLPTNLVASCQTERSQTQNKAVAWKMLAAKLQQLQDAERLQELQDLMGERGTVGWGHQIRSYVLQPTQMIKDLRTGYEVGNAQGALDGDLQGFIDAYLRWRLKGELQKSS